MGLKTKLGKLEQRAQVHYDVLVLPHGSEVKYPAEHGAKASNFSCPEREGAVA